MTFSAIPGSGAFVFCISSSGNGSKTGAGGGIPRVEYRRFIIDSTLDLSSGRTRGGGGMGPAAFSGMAGKLDCLRGRASAFLFFFLSELGAGVAILPHRSASDFLGRQLMNISFAPLSPLVSTKSVANKQNRRSQNIKHIERATGKRNCDSSCRTRFDMVYWT